MARPGRSSQSFPDVDSHTLKHSRVVRLKFISPLDWRLTLTYLCRAIAEARSDVVFDYNQRTSAQETWLRYFKA